MIAPLDALDWARYTHAYGSAADVPYLLRALRSPDAQRRYRALRELYGTIVHRGSRYEASAVAAGFLVELVDDEATPDRARLLELLTGLAIGYDASWLPAGLPVPRLRAWLAANPPDLEGAGDRLRAWMLTAIPGSEVPGTDEDRFRLHAHWEMATYDEVRLGVPIYHRLLCDADRETRIAAAYLLAWFAEDGPDSVPYLAAAAHDPDATVAATARVALGLLAETVEPVDPTEMAYSVIVGQLLNGLVDERAPVRWASAVAVARLLGPASPPEVGAELRGWTGDAVTEVPFLAGDAGEYAARSLALVEAPGAAPAKNAAPGAAPAKNAAPGAAPAEIGFSGTAGT